ISPEDLPKVAGEWSSTATTKRRLDAASRTPNDLRLAATLLRPPLAPFANGVFTFRGRGSGSRAKIDLGAKLDESSVRCKADLIFGVAQESNQFALHMQPLDTHHSSRGRADLDALVCQSFLHFGRFFSRQSAIEQIARLQALRLLGSSGSDAREVRQRIFFRGGCRKNTWNDRWLLPLRHKLLCRSLRLFHS